MSDNRTPEHIETKLQAPCMITSVDSDYADFRYYPDENANSTVFPGFWDGCDGLGSYPSTSEYFEDLEFLAPDQYGILHILQVTYADGTTEETTKISVKPPTPLALPPTKEAIEWAQRIRARALTEIPEGR